MINCNRRRCITFVTLLTKTVTFHRKEVKLEIKNEVEFYTTSLDFYIVKVRKERKSNTYSVYPDFQVESSKDLMVRGGSFYAVWDKDNDIWNTDLFEMVRMIDRDMANKCKMLGEWNPDDVFYPRTMVSYQTNLFRDLKSYLNNMPDMYKPLDSKITFENTKTVREDYVSKHVPYSLNDGKYEAYEELISTLYAPIERQKIEWSIGSVFAGDSVNLQKFFVLYGSPGSGKSTVLNIIQDLFDGYYTTFESKQLVGKNTTFSGELFKDNPLVGIQHDGDLSDIHDNSRLNSIISHEYITINEKFKPEYVDRAKCILYMATNRPVMISEAKSGVFRRLIEIRPSESKIEPRRYHELVKRVKFELGAIANRCLNVYKDLGFNYYDGYQATDMMLKSNDFYNFIIDNSIYFKKHNYVTLNQAWTMYKEYCDFGNIKRTLSLTNFRDELKNYFLEYKDFDRVFDSEENKMVQKRKVYSQFYLRGGEEDPETYTGYSIDLEETESIFDKHYYMCKAQYATYKGYPQTKWDSCKTRLEELDTHKLHFVQVPVNHIVIDFDAKVDGEKNLEKNLELAAEFPPTYSEVSQSGKGLHLHYFYEGDPTKLAPVYDDDIEIKVFTGNSSLRRKLTLCNKLPITTISSGLPEKGEKKVIDEKTVKSEKGLRRLIQKNLRKEIHPNTKPSVDFIKKILDDAYESGMRYDVSDLKNDILAFANNSSNQSDICVKTVSKMKFHSKEEEVFVEEAYVSDDLIFYDVEVFPNLFVIVWKAEGKQPVKMINPSAHDVEELFKMKLVGFNCRRYDNHILYAAYLGYSNEELYHVSQRIINGSRDALFMEAYRISYADIYDFSSVKQSLKKFEIDLGIHHQECNLPWDQPVDKSRWDEVADYCVNDVIATEETFKARHEDFVARQILADLSGLTVNDTTRKHAGKIIFGEDKNPQTQFVYTDLSQMFPGYEFDHGKSSYRGEDPGEGGYVYSEPGYYGDVALLDVASMHPTSIIELNLFGDKYTAKFKELVDARLAIKNGDFDKAKKMFNGKLIPYLKNDDPVATSQLAYALKIVINSIYGYTSASFPNLFRDERNKDNIVAKRGALFMINLKHEVESRGYTVAHIKTDSIKIPDATPKIVDFVIEYGKKYGYHFEEEATYNKMCLFNRAVYVAMYAGGKHDGEWVAVGKQFKRPYVFKKLFSKEDIHFDDLCEARTVKTALYLDMNEDLKEAEHNYQFVGKTGLFCPIKPGKGGGILLREQEGKYYSATDSKDHRWLESEMVKTLDKEKDMDKSYYNSQVEEAMKDIADLTELKGVDPEWFISDKRYDGTPF